LSVVSLAMVGHWFVRRLHGAMAVYTVVMSIGFMIAFPAVGSAIQHWGWRRAWLGVGLGLLAGLAPLAAIVVRRSPEARGLAADGATAFTRETGDLEGYRWRDAVASPAFWVFAIGTALYGLIASGIGLFNESILAERGFGPEIYYQTLVVTALTALAGNVAGGWLAGRVRLGVLLAASLGILTIGLLALPHVSALWQVMAWAAAMGVGGGLVIVLFFSVWPRVFGRRELGRIQGTAQALTVLASAIGPLLLAWCIEWTGSYAAMFRLLAGMIAVTAAYAAVVRLPPPAPQWRAPRTLRPAETDR
jgi:MFS family permease